VAYPLYITLLKSSNRACDVLDFIAFLLSHVVAGMFAIGIIGCLFVIPITVYRLFSVLFEEDTPDDD
jgi:hypothetical protein